MIAKYAGAAIFLAVVCALAAGLATESLDADSTLRWYSVVPPVLAIILAFLTRHVILSLGVAIVVGGFLNAVPKAPLEASAWQEGFASIGNSLYSTVIDPGNLIILAFIPPIFVMIQLIMVSGGFRGIILRLLKFIKGKKSAQLATVLMGILCFIDDYANAIVVGSMMQPVTDRFRISREKLAFLVDATSAPVSGLAMVSTWIAYEVGLFSDIADKLGIERNGYSMFFDALHFRFYCLLMLGFVVLHVLLCRDFGPMRKAEERASSTQPKDDIIAERPGNIRAANSKRDYALNALIPLAGLITFHLVGLWLDGDGPARLAHGQSAGSIAYWRDVISGTEHSTHILAAAAVFGMLLACICGGVSGSLDASAVRKSFSSGVKRAVLPSIILVLAWSLKNCCDTLQTGEFLTSMLAERVSPHWFPAILFIISSITSFATGTSWGTMAILIPTAIPIAFALDGDSYGLITMISLGAVLDGAIFGDHCSPISDTTIISSTATDCKLMAHVRTQLPYSLLVGAIAVCFAYLPASRGLNPGLSLVLGLAIILLVLGALRRTNRAA